MSGRVMLPSGVPSSGSTDRPRGGADLRRDEDREEVDWESVDFLRTVGWEEVWNGLDATGRSVRGAARILDGAATGVNSEKPGLLPTGAEAEDARADFGCFLARGLGDGA